MCQSRHQLKDVLFFFAFNEPLAEFTWMLWIIIIHEYKSLTHKLHFRWDGKMLQYVVITSLIQFALHLVHIPNFAISKCPPHHNTASSMLYGRCDTEGCCSFTNSLLHIDTPIWAKDFELDSTALFSNLWVLLPTGPFWHCFASLTVVSWQQFCYTGQFHWVFSLLWMLTHFFTTLVQLHSEVSNSQPSVMQACDTDEIVLPVVSNN